MSSTAAESCEKLNRRDFELLGRVFMAEIQNLLPAQIGKSKAVASLHERGYIEPYTRTLPGALPVTIKGWALTHAGRFTYCQNCTRAEFK
jgi:hypothetical protein